MAEKTLRRILIAAVWINGYLLGMEASVVDGSSGLGNLGRCSNGVVSINSAEAIIAPFWDSALDEVKFWIVEHGSVRGLRVYQRWNGLAYEWSNGQSGETAFKLNRKCDIACGEYDKLIMSIVLPPDASVAIVVDTDRGQVHLKHVASEGGKYEVGMDLNGAVKILSVSIRIISGREGFGSGWINWVGLQNSGALTKVNECHSKWGPEWASYIKDEQYSPTFQPKYGIYLNADELALLRVQHNQVNEEIGGSPFLVAAENASRINPEELIGEYVNFLGDNRFNRVRDHGRVLLNHGVNAAIAGHLIRDKRLLRLAARYALSLAMCRHWNEGFVCNYPGGLFEHRCFVQSLCAYDISAILDLAGEMFTELGKDYLLRRLAEEAVPAIQYVAWKHDYVHACNQISWFSPGRLLALGVMARSWPRVQPYLELAVDDLRNNVAGTVLADGGYAEGPTYFRCVGRDAVLGLRFYSRIAGKHMDELLPDKLRQCGEYGEAIISTRGYR